MASLRCVRREPWRHRSADVIGGDFQSGIEQFLAAAFSGRRAITIPPAPSRIGDQGVRAALATKEICRR